MALQGWAPSNLVRGPAVATAAPLTMAAWARSSNIAAGGNLVGLYNSSSAGNSNQFKLATTTSGGLIYRVGNNAGTTSAATATATFGNDTWFHACAVEYTSNNRAVFLDGANKGTDTTSLVPTGIDRASLGLRDHSGNDQAWANDAVSATGQIAEAAIWNVALNDEEIAALARGFSPALIRPQNLVAYLPVVRSIIDARGNAFAAVGALAVADHCRISYAR